MGRDSGIAWTDHTFNPWWGCVKVSPACTHCYAETMDQRFGGGHWGPGSTRKKFTDKHWNGPVRWNREAGAVGVRARVFCASMADVFEDHPDVAEERLRLWCLIRDTPSLDWLLLTKRPENIRRLTPDEMRGAPNVWLGTTVENQQYADERIPMLLSNPAVHHFLSMEPLLGEVDVTPWVNPIEDPETGADLHSVDWVITGCESGPGARPQVLSWYRSLRDQCRAARVAFFLKQMTKVAGPIDADDPLFHRKLPIVGTGPGSWTKPGELVEQPYLDGVQHVELPRPR